MRGAMNNLCLSVPAIRTDARKEVLMSHLQSVSYRFERGKQVVDLKMEKEAACCANDGVVNESTNLQIG
jgi:hypothetical protein